MGGRTFRRISAATLSRSVCIAVAKAAGSGCPLFGLPRSRQKTVDLPQRGLDRVVGGDPRRLLGGGMAGGQVLLDRSGRAGDHHSRVLRLAVQIHRVAFVLDLEAEPCPPPGGDVGRGLLNARNDSPGTLDDPRHEAVKRGVDPGMDVPDDLADARGQAIEMQQPRQQVDDQRYGVR